MGYEIQGQGQKEQYTKSDAARELGMSRPTLDRMIKAGNIKLNKCGRISGKEVEHLIHAKSHMS
jgi:predicted DNA-binding protein (UPF0251 family)